VPNRIVVVDDEELVRSGLVDLLASMEEYSVVAEAASAAEAGPAIERSDPDLVVVDVILGEGLDGIQLTRDIKAERPFLPIVILSGRDEALFAEEALLAGASGYVLKGDTVKLLEAIRNALDGGLWVSRNTQARLLPDALRALVDRSKVPPGSEEERVLQELERGNRTVEGLSRTLGLKRSAVERALDELQLDLGLPSRASLYLYVDAA
jgi:DNA-binding NarL/FixJ family response regulator